MEFNERTPLESGFSAVFARDVRPRLLELEDERVARLGKARRYAAIALGVSAALAALIVLILGPAEGALVAAFVAVVFGVIAGFAAWRMQAHGWAGSVAEAVMPAVCDHVGDLSYDRSAARGFPVGQVKALGMVGSYSSARLSDRLEGRYRDTGFELVEAHLTRRSRGSDGKSKTRTVFRGLLLRIAVPITAPTTILIARDYGGIGNAFAGMFAGEQGRGMPRVALEHDRFEDAFEVHADDADAARRFLPPLFLDSLLAIGEETGGRRGARAMTAGFEGDWFFLALGRDGDFLKMGSLRTPVAAMEDDLHGIFDDIALVRGIIDRLHGDAV